ncbi:hypothetical protein J6590_005670 [Homalodisca vitripennis]|nr:hypothetical protein J6590_005670 [Homalodisca vitripennis]
MLFPVLAPHYFCSFSFQMTCRAVAGSAYIDLSLSPLYTDIMRYEPVRSSDIIGSCSNRYGRSGIRWRSFPYKLLCC